MFDRDGIEALLDMQRGGCEAARRKAEAFAHRFASYLATSSIPWRVAPRASKTS